MILVDTSVAVDYARGKDAKLIALMRTLPVVVCGIVRAELLDSVWDIVGDNLAMLRSRGITVPFPDAVIATLGIESHLEVWAHDPHFLAMQSAMPALQLFTEPP